jgi:exodeoxyribonuclease VII large subunit
VNVSTIFPGPVSIKAELSNLRYNYDSKYYSLSLVQIDADGQITSFPAVIWRNGLTAVKRFENVTKQSFGNGLELSLIVKVKYHPSRGITINILDINPEHFVGSINAKRNINIQKLTGAGVLISGEGACFSSPNKNLTVSKSFARVAFIGSRSSDGYHDFINEITTNANGFGYSITLYDTPVQGQFAAKLMSEILLEIDFTRSHYDVIVISRGGGSQNDLSCFDDYDLAYLIANFPIPIVTGIGHERDQTICDLVAWRSTKTPTRAAVEIVEYDTLFEASVTLLMESIVSIGRDLIDTFRSEVDLLFSDMVDVTRNVTRQVELAIDAVFAEIKSYDVALTLSRGFAIATIENVAITTRESLCSSACKKLTLRFSDGVVSVLLIDP